MVTLRLASLFLIIYAVNAARFGTFDGTGSSILQPGAAGSDVSSQGEAARSLEESDLVSSLPGFSGNLRSKHYAGYIEVNPSTGKRLFYYFVESERDPANVPVVLWLNGGPGCSSFDGFVYEQGPFKFALKQDAETKKQVVTLSENPYAWSKIANMIFLDSPAGVGLSYSDSREDYFTDDMRTAADANVFLRKWFERYPAYQSNAFFVSGESYAGIYVPNLARAVVEGNEEGEEPRINIQGYLVGNGVTDVEVDGNALPSFAVGKSLVSVGQYNRLQAACRGNFWNTSDDGSECDRLMDDLVSELSDLNVYDVLEDCYIGPNPPSDGDDDDDEDSLKAGAAGGSKGTMLKALRAHGRQWPVLGSTPKAGAQVKNWAHLGLTPPCTDARQGFVWLNDPAVRKAIHAEPVSKIGSWQLCSDKIFYTRVVQSTIPIHKALTKQHGLRALIYSGDHDMAVPHSGSEAWTSALGFEVLAPWQPWFVDEQVAGYTVEYSGLTYATVKGAGHMVPENKPRESLAMFSRFLDARPLHPGRSSAR